MANLELLVKALDTSLWEMSESFRGLPDPDVWKRPHPRLLSVGELAAHVARWEAVSFLGEGFQSPLNSPDASYYTSSILEAFALPLVERFIKV